MSERKRTLSRRALATMSGVVLLSLAFPVVSLLSGAYSVTTVRVSDDGIFGESSDHFEEQTVAVYAQMLGFDASKQRADMAYYPWPTDDLAKQFSSSVVGKNDIRLFVDAQDAQLTEFPSGTQVGGVEVTVDVLSSDFPDLASDSLYPFDRYAMDSYVQVETRANSSEEYKPIQTFDYFYTSPVSGFDVTYQRLAAFDSAYPGADESRNLEEIAIERSEGKISFYAFIERTFAVKAIAVIIYLFVAIAAITQIFVFYMIAVGKRPPSMSGLTWAAATLLGLVQLRMVAPGDPRIGVFADIVIFFPAMILTLTSLVGITYLWNSRKDFLT